VYWFGLTITTATAIVTKPVKNIVPPAPSRMPAAKPGWAAAPPEKPRIKSNIFEGGNNIVNLMMGTLKMKSGGIQGFIYEEERTRLDRRGLEVTGRLRCFPIVGWRSTGWLMCEALRHNQPVIGSLRLFDWGLSPPHNVITLTDTFPLLVLSVKVAMAFRLVRSKRVSKSQCGGGGVHCVM
jgi:hypothetical protein